MIEYKFKEGESEKPANERTIEKTGEPVEFSMVQFDNDEAKFEKILKELNGNRDIQKSITDNIDQHHPTIKDIPEFDRYTIHMYQEAFALIKQYNAKIEEIEKQFETYKAEKVAILEQLPELALIPSPMSDEINANKAVDVNEVAPSEAQPNDETPKESTE
jgi:calcineurin-like phosphoesterase family protein